MPDFPILGGFPEGKTKTLPAGTVVVVSVGVAALVAGVALNLWLGGSVGNPKIWVVVTMAVAILTFCLAAFSLFRDHEEDEYNQYIANLRAIIKKTHDFKVK
jgi:membrane protein implicated in regulation of membrane protease activity